MDKQKFLNTGLLEQYVLGLTSEAESRKVELYLNEFPELVQTKNELERCMEEVAKECAIPAPPSLKAKILTDIDAQANSVTSPSEIKNLPTNTGLKWGLGLAAASLIGLSIFCFSLYNENENTKSELNQMALNYAALEENCNERKSQNEILASTNNFLKDANTHAVTLEGSSLSPQASAVAFWNKAQKSALLDIVYLPQPPKEKQYQVWADVEGEMIDMGVIDLVEGELIKLPFIANAESLNITLEPKGGSKTPTVEQIYISGKV